MPRFGQRCFVHRYPSQIVGKLDAKSKEGISLGFRVGAKDAYKVFSEGKIYISRNIIFCDDTNACLSKRENSKIPSTLRGYNTRKPQVKTEEKALNKTQEQQKTLLNVNKKKVNL